MKKSPRAVGTPWVDDSDWMKGVSMNLIDDLVKQLGVNREQAQGGVGLFVDLLKKNLDGGTFGELLNQAPILSKCQDQAPETGGGLWGTLGGLASAFGGESGADLGRFAGLADGFSKLGLDPSMITRFLPLVMQFIQSEAGQKVWVKVREALDLA